MLIGSTNLFDIQQFAYSHHMTLQTIILIDATKTFYAFGERP